MLPTSHLTVQHSFSMPNFGVALPPSDPYGSKENHYSNGGQSSAPTVPGVLFPGKLGAETNHSSFGGSSFASRPGFSSSFQSHANEAASPATMRSGEFPRNPLLAKTPTLSSGNVTPRKVSFGTVISQNNSFKLQGSIAAESTANTSFAPEASPLGLSRSNYSFLARSSVDNQEATLTPMSVENGPSESLVTGAHSPAVTFFGVGEDYLSHSTSYMPQTPGSCAPFTPGKSLLNCSVVSHLQSQDPWSILSSELQNLAYWKDPLASAAVFSGCSVLLTLTRIIGFSAVSVVCYAVIGTILLGCFIHGLEKSLGLTSPSLQRVTSLPLFSIDSWETATLALVACSFRGTEAFFVHLRQVSSPPPQQSSLFSSCSDVGHRMVPGSQRPGAQPDLRSAALPLDRRHVRRFS